MATRFYCTSEVAHQLTKVKKQTRFFFRALTRTDKIGRVYCEATAPMMNYIKENGIEVEIDTNTNHLAAFLVGRRIQELRKEAGMTQKELAEKCGIAQPNIARIEAGTYTTSIDVLTRVADALGKRIDLV